MAEIKKRKNKKIATNVLSIILMIIAIVAVFGYAIPAYNNAQNIGVNIGDGTGKIVGNVLGSFDGITTGLAKGAEEGKVEGLSAKDTKSEIKNNFTEIGNLEVLEAGVKLKNVSTLGNDYAALFLLKGVAIYSVNLKQTDIIENENGTMEILLPDITVEIYIDENATEKIAEYQKRSWTGSAQDGFTAYMNSREATDKSVKDTMENYSALTEAAEESAIKQIEIIAKAATGNKKDIVVRFKREVETNE